MRIHWLITSGDMLWSSIKFSLLYYNSLRKRMEIKLENLYVDVRAKKTKDHWQLTRNLHSCGKNQQLVGKSTIGLWQENFSFEILGTSLPFLEELAYCKAYIFTHCFHPIWPSQKPGTNENCKMLCRNIHNNIFRLKLAGKQEYSAWTWTTTFLR